VFLNFEADGVVLWNDDDGDDDNDNDHGSNDKVTILHCGNSVFTVHEAY